MVVKSILISSLRNTTDSSAPSSVATAINLAASSFDLHLFVHSAGSRRILGGISISRVYAGCWSEKWSRCLYWRLQATPPGRRRVRAVRPASVAYCAIMARGSWSTRTMKRACCSSSLAAGIRFLFCSSSSRSPISDYQNSELSDQITCVVVTMLLTCCYVHPVC